MKRLIFAALLLAAATAHAQMPGSPIGQSGGGAGSGGGGTGCVTSGVVGQWLSDNGAGGCTSNSLPSADLLVGSGTAKPAAVALSGDCTLTNTGAITCTKTNGTLFGTAATQNTGTSGATIPLLSTANTWTLGQTFSAAPTLGSITGATQCLHVSTAGLVSGTGSDCGTGGGAVSSVSSGGNGIVVSPTTGAVVVSSSYPSQTKTASYTIVSTDLSSFIWYNSASAGTFTIPQAIGSFANGAAFCVGVEGAGALTLSPTTSTIYGIPSLTLNQNDTTCLVSDGTNWGASGGIARGSSGVTSFNTRTGAVTLQASDVSGVGGALLNTSQSFGAGQAVTPTTGGTQSPGGTLTPDLNASNSVTLTFGAGNLTIANPTGVKAGQGYVFALTQDATGSRTVTWGTEYKWGSGTAPTLSTAAGAKDVISCFADTTTTLNCTLVVKDSR